MVTTPCYAINFGDVPLTTVEPSSIWEGALGNPPTNGYVLSSTTSGTRSWIAPPISTPGGSNTQVQFNDSGAFNGDASFVWDKTNKKLTLGGGAFISYWPGTGGAWIDLPTAGASAIGTGGVGGNVMLGYAQAANQFFAGAQAGDTAYRNNTGQKMMFGIYNSITLLSTFDVLYGEQRFSSTALLDWSSTTDTSGAADVGFARNAAGVVEINNGTAGTFADLKARNLTLTGTCTGCGGGGGTPGTPTTSIQFNNAGAFGGSANLEWDNTNSNVLFTTDTGLHRNAAGVLEVNNGIDGQWGALKTGVRDAGTSAVANGLTLGHQSTGTPTTGFGTGIMVNANDSTTADVNIGALQFGWSTATHGTNASYMDLQLTNGGGVLVGGMRFGPNWLSVGSTNNPGSGVVNAAGGYWYGNAAPTTGRFLQAPGASSSFQQSGYALPTGVSTSPYDMVSNGTNVVFVPVGANTSTAAQASAFAADTYITNSTITLNSGVTLQGIYTFSFDMTKTAAGVAAPVLTVRVGSGGTITDIGAVSHIYAAGTAAVDNGIWQCTANFRSVGASAVMVLNCVLSKTQTTTGLTNTTGQTVVTTDVGAPFSTSGATKIGVSFNGGASFSGTVQQVVAEYKDATW